MLFWSISILFTSLHLITRQVVRVESVWNVKHWDAPSLLSSGSKPHVIWGLRHYSQLINQSFSFLSTLTTAPDFQTGNWSSLNTVPTGLRFKWPLQATAVLPTRRSKPSAKLLLCSSSFLQEWVTHASLYYFLTIRGVAAISGTATHNRVTHLTRKPFLRRGRVGNVGNRVSSFLKSSLFAQSRWDKTFSTFSSYWVF